MTFLERYAGRKVEAWVLWLTILVCVLGAMLVGYLVWYNMKGGKRFLALTDAVVAAAASPHLLIKSVQAMVSGSDLAVPDPAPGETGFRYTYPAATGGGRGYLMLNRYDGDRRKSVSELVDLDRQRTVHTWVYDVDTIWERLEMNSKLRQPAVDVPTDRFQGFHALPDDDGSVVTQGMGSPLLKFDVCSRLVWAQAEDMFHHAIERDREGNVWVPSYIEPKRVTIGRDEDFFEDAVTKVSPKGEILFQRSVIGILERNGLGAMIYGHGQVHDNDPTHLNDIQPVPKAGPYWQEGDVFISLRNLSMLALYRPSTDRILWYRIGPWTGQHDVDVLDDTRISVFNNNTRLHGVSDMNVDGTSEEQIFDFRTGSVTSPMKRGFDRLGIRAAVHGLGDIQPDGRIMVEDSVAGHLVEFDAEGGVAWRFVNRATDGAVYAMNWSRRVSRAQGDRILKAAEKAGCDAP